MAISIAENLIDVRKRLKRAARKAGRDTSEITLVAVTKTLDVKEVKEAIKEGLRVFGESYMQEAQEKINKIGDKQKKWHFIGHLQKNKAKFAVELFDCIHSVDTPGLAREINKRATRTIDVLIQVNISGEKTKHGATPEGAIEIARLMPGLKNLNFRGLMAIPPAVDVPERSRPYFVTLRRLAERINRERIPGVVVRDLSMGMSSDFDVAIEEGATMVRVGTAIFGAREAAAQKGTAKKTGPATKPASTAKKPGAKKGAVKKETTPLTKEKKKASPQSKAVPKKSATGTKKTTAKAKKAAPAKTPAVKAKKTSSAKTPAAKAKKTIVATKKAAATAKKTTALKKAVTKTKKPAAAAKKAVTTKTGTAIAKKKTVKTAGAKKTAAATRPKAKKTKAAGTPKNSTAKKKSAPTTATKKSPPSKGAAKKTKKAAASKKK